MASATIISSLRRTRSPTMEAFLAPVDLTHLTGISLLETLLAISYGIQATFSLNKKLSFQRMNSRSLIRKLEVFIILLEFLRDSRSSLPPSAILCFTELYMMLYRSKMLLDYCFHSSKLWLLLQNHSISSHFHDLNQEISTLLDVLPLDELNLTEDVREQVELLRKQARRSKLLIDKHDETLRLKLFSFLDEFENDRIPLPVELQSFFVEKLGFIRPKHFIYEIEFLEEQIVNYEGDIEPTVSVLYGFVSLIRYSRFMLFGFEEDEDEEINSKKPKKSLITQGIAETFFSSPKDFFCPISLEMMRDPVIISTGQTYDRSSISRWFDENHTTCPKTGQILIHNKLVANHALRNLISQWCIAHEIFYDCSSLSNQIQTLSPFSSSNASVKANKATTGILIHELAEGSESSKTIAVREIRLIAKTCRQNRVYIAESGAIPYLKSLLSSPNPVAQENSVTALLNLSIHEKNKKLIMEECCLGPIINVLRFGHTTEARENAATTLFSLSAVHHFKKMITEEDGAVEALCRLMRYGTPRGKKDAVTALFNLSTHNDNYKKLVEYGAVAALVEALEVDGIAEEAAGALALIVRVPVGAEAIGNAERGVSGLMDLMRRGSSKGKENAVAALLELCRTGGSAGAAERVMRAPALANSLQKLMYTGTKRARRKATSLARIFQKCEYAMSFRYYGGNSRESSSGFGGGMLSSVVAVVPVL
ncbi:U-box domain-containing protein 17-like [Impatiens glandulifera]|uniref:U-box domain-containing protein 17-like n=1 Tax=Impatiens glandulifera TaxID=253017 RepID=UPI001FB07AC7|nr:U-box domain-containing protein 17-like [Impatiens glandulifera]